MSDALLSIQDRQEALSRTYTAAIAASAGYTTYEPSVDRDSVDLGINAGGSMRPNLHLQLKATINLRKAGDVFKFPLKRKNYDDLRAQTQVPRIIVVLSLPKNEETWVNVSLQKLVLKRSAFWASLKNMPELPDGQQSTTIEIPVENHFDVDGLKRLMQMARTGTVI